MKRCTNCKKLVDDNLAFCPNCQSSNFEEIVNPAPGTSGNTIFCTGCGKKIPTYSKFCPFCGKAITDKDRPAQAEAPHGGSTAAPPPSSSAPRPAAKKNPPPILLILFIIFVLGGSVGLNSCSTPSPTAKPAPKTTTTSTVKKEVQKVPLPASLQNVEVNKNVIGEPVLTVVLANNTDKTINAFKVCVDASNNYGEQVKRYGSDQFYFGLSQDTIAPGAQSNANQYWTMHGFENGTTFKVQLWSIHFTDGATWESKQSDKEEVTVKKGNKVIR